MKSHQPDYILLTSVAILVVFGLVMLYSASMNKGQEDFGQPHAYLKHQLIYGLSIALLAAAITYKVNYKFWKKIAFFVMLGAIALLIMVFLPGFSMEYGGATRWISFRGHSFQPSEISKLALIIYLAAWLDEKIKSGRDFNEIFWPFMIATGLVVGLIILQPNIGTASIVGLTATVIFFVAGARGWQIGTMFVIATILFFSFLKIFSHAANRFMIFLHPEIDPQGIGYQINQAILAIGSGGIFGRGLGQSIQKYNYLPEPMGDSIFAIIAEELGFIWVTLIVLLFLIIAIQGFKIAKNSSDNFAKLLAIGITFWITCQAFINIAAISGLLPLTGVPLPLVSYGGTAMIVSLTGIGILLNISKYTKN